MPRLAMLLIWPRRLAALDRPFHLVARLDEACLIAEFVGVPVADDHLYLRSHHFVGGSWPRCVSSLPKPHLFLQLRQSDRVVIHGIPSPSSSDDGIVGRNDGRILSFVGFKEGGGPLSAHPRTGQDRKAAIYAGLPRRQRTKSETSVHHRKSPRGVWRVGRLSKAFQKRRCQSRLSDARLLYSLPLGN